MRSEQDPALRPPFEPQTDRFFVYTDPITGKLTVLNINLLLKQLPAQIDLSQNPELQYEEQYIFPKVKDTYFKPLITLNNPKQGDDF